MPRRTYVRIQDGVPIFPVNRDNTVLPSGAEVGDLVMSPNGRIIGRRASVPLSPIDNDPAYRTMMVGAEMPMRIGTAAYTGSIGHFTQDPTPEMVPVRFPNMPSGLTNVEEDFVLMHSGAEAASALDQLLEDDDDPISEG